MSLKTSEGGTTVAEFTSFARAISKANKATLVQFSVPCGWKDAALAEISRAKEKPDGWGMAALFAHAGDHDAALRSLEQASPAEREHWYYDLRLGPHWDSLRSDARFEKILASSAPKTAR